MALVTMKTLLEQAQAEHRGVGAFSVGNMEMNEVYKGFFKEGNYPARSAVQVAALPQDALVEIEVIALKGE